MGETPKPKRTVELPWSPEELQRRQTEAWQRAREQREQRRGSSMRTLFELRGRPWFVRPLITLALGVGAYYAVTRLFLH